MRGTSFVVLVQTRSLCKLSVAYNLLGSLAQRTFSNLPRPNFDVSWENSVGLEVFADKRGIFCPLNADAPIESIK